MKRFTLTMAALLLLLVGRVHAGSVVAILDARAPVPHNIVWAE